MNYQKVIVIGNVTGDARCQSAEGKVATTSFSVGVSDAKGKSTFFPVWAFGKHGEAIAQYITKGRQVLVEGRIQVAESKAFSIIASRIVLGATPGKSAQVMGKVKSK